MLQLTPNAKKKKGTHAKWTVTPFPSCSGGAHHSGVFTGISVEVCNKQDMYAIYECGCYGKGSKSRSAPRSMKPAKRDGETVLINETEEKDETLALDLEESFFLAFFLEVLQIYDLGGILISWQQLLKSFLNLKKNFVECFVAYLYLKSKNWVVKSGTKFGGNFLLYKKGPRYFHASFIVFISAASLPVHMKPKDIKGLQRIAETSDKDVLLLEVTTPEQVLNIVSLEDFSLFKISETIIRRFNYTAFVQSQNSTK